MHQIAWPAVIFTLFASCILSGCSEEPLREDETAALAVPRGAAPSLERGLPLVSEPWPDARTLYLGPDGRARLTPLGNDSAIQVRSAEWTFVSNTNSTITGAWTNIWVKVAEPVPNPALSSDNPFGCTWSFSVSDDQSGQPTSAGPCEAIEGATIPAGIYNLQVFLTLMESYPREVQGRTTWTFKFTQYGFSDSTTPIEILTGPNYPSQISLRGLKDVPDGQMPLCKGTFVRVSPDVIGLARTSHRLPVSASGSGFSSKLDQSAVTLAIVVHAEWPTTPGHLEQIRLVFETPSGKFIEFSGTSPLVASLNGTAMIDDAIRGVATPAGPNPSVAVRDTRVNLEVVQILACPQSESG